MKDFLKQVQQTKPEPVIYPPDFVIREEVKKIMTTDTNLRNEICKRFEISVGTLYNWIKDHPLLTNFTLLYLVWDYLSCHSPGKYPRLTDILTEKKQEA